jgi:hypothetical protein
MTAFTGLDGDGNKVKATNIYQRSQDQINSSGSRVGVVTDRKTEGFGPQELARRMGFKLSGGSVIMHTNLTGPSADKNMIKNFAQMAKTAKAGHVKKLHKNVDMKNKAFADMVNKTLGMNMQRSEVGDLAGMGPDEYGVADDIVRTLLNDTSFPHPAAYYLGLSENGVKAITNKDERAFAQKIRGFDTDEKTKDLG